eukprot:6645356-Alexandrium_andersonii.AAC.1
MATMWPHASKCATRCRLAMARCVLDETSHRKFQEASLRTGPRRAAARALANCSTVWLCNN